jgi:hypothetical protein
VAVAQPNSRLPQAGRDQTRLRRITSPQDLVLADEGTLTHRSLRELRDWKALTGRVLFGVVDRTIA